MEQITKLVADGTLERSVAAALNEPLAVARAQAEAALGEAYDKRLAAATAALEEARAAARTAYEAARTEWAAKTGDALAAVIATGERDVQKILAAIPAAV